MGLLCKRYDMIALLLQAAPKVHHNLPKAIITLNSPKVNITVAPAVEQVPQKALLLIIGSKAPRIYKYKGHRMI